ncbi:ferredoxin [Kitasatospora kazusensis]|uniref:ferredoxin n=1 Tax=Kitasatospora kazusensis TaxID=407974 RepID=UPI0031E11A17
MSVDQDRCCSSGQCVLTAPTVFDQSDEDGYVQLLQARPGPALAAEVRLAAALCPGRAITVSEAVGDPGADTGADTGSGSVGEPA